MLWTNIVAIAVLWTVGFGFEGAFIANLIHILLVIALVVLILQYVRERRA